MPPAPLTFGDPLPLPVGLAVLEPLRDFLASAAGADLVALAFLAVLGALAAALPLVAPTAASAFSSSLRRRSRVSTCWSAVALAFFAAAATWPLSAAVPPRRVVLGAWEALSARALVRFARVRASLVAFIARRASAGACCGLVALSTVCGDFFGRFDVEVVDASPPLGAFVGPAGFALADFGLADFAWPGRTAASRWSGYSVDALAAPEAACFAVVAGLASSGLATGLVRRDDAGLAAGRGLEAGSTTGIGSTSDRGFGPALTVVVVASAVAAGGALLAGCGSVAGWGAALPSAVLSCVAVGPFWPGWGALSSVSAFLPGPGDRGARWRPGWRPPAP